MSNTPAPADTSATWRTRATTAIVEFVAGRAYLRPVTRVLPDWTWLLPLIDRGVSRAVRSLATPGPSGTPGSGATVTPVRGSAHGLSVEGEWVRAAGVTDRGAAILYLHGSGYLVLSPREYRAFAAAYSAAANLPVFLPRYRMAPRYTFPAGSDDGFAAYHWLLDQGYRSIVVSGDSAGGHVGAGLAVQLRDSGSVPPVAVALFAPLIDPTWRTAAVFDATHRDRLIPAATARRLTDHYFTDPESRDPRFCVLRGELTGLPPMLVQAGALEMLSADAAALVDAVTSAGGRAELLLWPNRNHGFYLGAGLMPDSTESIRRAGEFARRACAPLDGRLGA